jgi:hypothetical protein
MQWAGAQVEHWRDSQQVPARKAKQQSVTENVSSRMSRTSKHAFADHFEAFYREPRFGGVPSHDSDLRLGVDHIDVRNVPRDGIFRAIGRLKSEHEPARQFLRMCGEAEEQD